MVEKNIFYLSKDLKRIIDKKTGTSASIEFLLINETYTINENIYNSMLIWLKKYRPELLI
jgi:hypothetical protein